MKAENYKIGCYIRVSTEEQAKNPEGSIKNQQERIKQAVSFKNMSSNGSFGEIVDFYVDRGKSGKDTNRPELQRLLSDIQCGKITLVAVSELSRISRNIKDFSEIWQMMKELDCSFYSLRENFDSTTAAGEMVLFSMANLAQFERRQISERVAANMNSRASRGLYNGGSVPLGYKTIKEKPGYLEIDEDAARIVKQCFKAYLANDSLSRTAKWLNQNGYSINPNRKGPGGDYRCTFFYVGNLKRILTNKIYIGVKKYKERGEVKEAKAVWPPIVDKSLFERVNKTLKKNQSRKKPPAKDRFPYVLSGLVYCMDCGEVLCGKSAHGNGGKFGYYEHSWANKRNSTLAKKVYQCTNYTRINALKLEPAIFEIVSKLLSSKETAEALYRKFRELHEQNPGKKELERIRTKISGFDRQLVTLAKRLAELPESVSATPIYKLMEEAEKEKNTMENLLREKRANGEVSEAELPEYSDYERFLSIASTALRICKDESGKAKIISGLIKKIEVSREQINIVFYIGSLNKKSGLPKSGNPLFLFHLEPKFFGSSSLTNGGRDGT